MSGIGKIASIPFSIPQPTMLLACSHWSPLSCLFCTRWAFITLKKEALPASSRSRKTRVTAQIQSALETGWWDMGPPFPPQCHGRHASCHFRNVLVVQCVLEHCTVEHLEVVKSSSRKSCSVITPLPLHLNTLFFSWYTDLKRQAFISVGRVRELFSSE